MSTLRAGTLVNSRLATGAAGFTILAAVVVLAPLLILPGKLLYFDVTPKVAVVLFGTAAALLFGSLHRWPAREAQLRFGWLLALQAASLLLSTALSSLPALSFSGSNWRRFGLVTQLSLLVFAWLLVLSLAQNPAARVQRMLRVVAAGGVLVSLYGILQYLGWDPWLPARSYHVGEGVWTIVRPPATLGHAAYLANWLLHPVFAGVALMLAERKRAWKLLGAAAASLGLLAIVLSGTRAALLGFLAGAILLFLQSRPRFRPRQLLAAVLLAAGLVAFYVSPLGEKLRARVRWSVEDARGGARLLLWRDTLRMAGEHWAAGGGPETFSARFPRYQSAELSRAYPDFYHESPHNILLDALAAQGIPGLALLLALAALGFQAARRARAVHPILSGVLAAMLAAAMVGQQFTVFTLPTALYFYLTLAMLAPLAFPERIEQTERSGGARRAASLVVRAAVAALFTVFAVRLLVADRSLALVRSELEAGRLEAALQEHRRALAWQPWGMNAELWYSRSLAVLAGTSPNLLTRFQAARQAVAAGERATVASEEPHNAWYSLAALYAARNDATAVERCLRSAIAASPNWFKPHFVLAQVLARAGRLEEAPKEAAIAADLNGGRNPEVTRTLEAITAGSPVKSTPGNTR